MTRPLASEARVGGQAKTAGCQLRSLAGATTAGRPLASSGIPVIGGVYSVALGEARHSASWPTRPAGVAAP